MQGLSKDQLGGLAVLLFALAYLSQIGDIPVLDQNQMLTPRSMPIFLVTLAIPISLWLLIPNTGERPRLSGLNWQLLSLFVLLMLVYSLAIRPLGFILSSTAFLSLGFLLLGMPGQTRRWRFTGISFAIALLTAIAFWLLMDQVLGIYVKPSPW